MFVCLYVGINMLFVPTIMLSVLDWYYTSRKKVAYYGSIYQIVGNMLLLAIDTCKFPSLPVFPVWENGSKKIFLQM